MGIEQLQAWNKSVFFLTNGSDSLYLDGVFWTVTHTATWIPLLLAVLYIICKNNPWRKALFVVGMMALLILITDQVASGLCKPYFHILRPTHDPDTAPMVDIVNGYRGGLYGFFSSHAANTFAAATFLSLLFRSYRTAVVLTLFALSSTFSRLYLGVHSPLDIAVGTVFGIFAGGMIYVLYHLGEKRFCAQRDYFSSVYTSSGYLTNDLLLIDLVFALTLAYIAFRAIFLAVSF